MFKNVNEGVIIEEQVMKMDGLNWLKTGCNGEFYLHEAEGYATTKNSFRS
jgi:hypothetical protein